MDAAPAQLEDELEHARGDSRLASGRRVREDALEHLVLEYKPVQLGHVQHVRGRARRHRVAEALTAHDGERRVHRDALDRARDQVAIHGNHLLGDARYAHIRERLLASCLIAHRSPELLDVLEHGVNGPAAGWLERCCGLALSGRHRRKLGARLYAVSTVWLRLLGHCSAARGPRQKMTKRGISYRRGSVFTVSHKPDCRVERRLE